MSVKFLHTADWQMGMKALQAGNKARDVRAKRFETAAQVAELAKQEEVDFVLLAGDLFEHPDVDETVLRRTVTVLDAFAPIPVFVLPGNHDPLVAGGIWDRQGWRRAGDHVRLLREAAEVQVRDDVALYPAPLKQKQSTLDPTAWIPARVAGDRRIRIGIAHGALDVLPERANFPIAAARAEEAGLDYLALGDWHGFVQHGRAVYSGTMEQTSFSEKDPGNVVIVGIPSAGAEPVLTTRQVGTLHWRELTPDVRDVTDVENFRRGVLGAGALAAQLLRINLQLDTGATAEAVGELRSLREDLLEEAFFLDWPVETLDAAPSAAVLLPQDLLADVDRDLGAVLEDKIPEGLGREAASAEPDVVKEARALLRRLITEVQR